MLREITKRTITKMKKRLTITTKKDLNKKTKLKKQQINNKSICCFAIVFKTTATTTHTKRFSQPIERRKRFESFKPKMRLSI